MSDQITGFTLISLDEMVKQLGENITKNILSQFYCAINPDVESFLRDSNKAIQFALQGITVTYLVFSSYKSKPVLIAFFSITNKAISITQKGAGSNSMRKRIAKFATYNQITKRYHLSCPLIAQIGKNDKYKDLITGDELLKMACDNVRSAQALLGGRFVYLECEDKEKLKDFYSSNGFCEFGKRSLENDEKEMFEGEYLIQMLKYLH